MLLQALMWRVASGSAKVTLTTSSKFPLAELCYFRAGLPTGVCVIFKQSHSDVLHSNMVSGAKWCVVDLLHLQTPNGTEILQGLLSLGALAFAQAKFFVFGWITLYHTTSLTVTPTPPNVLFSLSENPFTAHLLCWLCFYSTEPVTLPGLGALAPTPAAPGYTNPSVTQRKLAYMWWPSNLVLQYSCLTVLRTVGHIKNYKRFE